MDRDGRAGQPAMEPGVLPEAVALLKSAIDLLEGSGCDIAACHVVNALELISPEAARALLSRQDRADLP